MAKKKQCETCKKLVEKLTDMLDLLDEQGLRFLYEQAEIHLHNMQILSEEKKIIASKSHNKPQLNRNINNADFEIKKSSDGNTYHIVSNGKWKLFSDTEMLSMVQIAQGKGSIDHIAHRLFLWIEAERPDAFADLDLGEQDDKKYKALVNVLKTKFAIRK